MGRGGDIPSYPPHRHSFVITIRIFRRFLFVVGGLYKVGVSGSGVTGLLKFMRIGIGRLFCGLGLGMGFSRYPVIAMRFALLLGPWLYSSTL